MCLLLTIAVPGAIGPGSGGRTLHVAPHAAGAGGHRYESGLTPYAVTSGGCSCDLVRDPVPRERRLQHRKRLAKRYRRKGWSAAKIERALADAGRRDEAAGGLRDDLAKLIGELLDEFQEVQLILHWHEADFATESFAVDDVVRLSSTQFAALEDVRENVRHVVRR